MIAAHEPRNDFMQQLLQLGESFQFSYNTFIECEAMILDATHCKEFQIENDNIWNRLYRIVLMMQSFYDENPCEPNPI
jgi:hypothetical protein